MLNDMGRGLADIRQGWMSWRMWLMLAWNDVRRRYRRSGLGQFWLTLSMGTMVGGLGVVYSSLFGVDVTKYLPYIAVTFVVWGVILPLVTESCNAFVENDNMLRHMYLPRSLFVFRLIARTLIIAAHNVLIIPVVFVYFDVGLNLNILWLTVGLVLVIANGFWFGFFLAIVCARFRDVPQIVTSVMQIMFFITPIMFLPEQLAQRGIAVLKWNPFAYLLEVMANPILGMPPGEWALTSCFVMAVAGFLIVLPFAGRYAPRAVYWL